MGQEEGTRRNAQEADDEDDPCWIEACEGIAKKLLKCLEDSEVTKVSARELKEQTYRCSEKAIRYWQIASMVAEEGGEAHTVNLCQQCHNEQMVQQGKPLLKSWQWRAVVEKEAHRGRM